MRLVIDGRRLTAGRTGVGRYLECLLAEWGVTGWPFAETLIVLKDRRGLESIPKGEVARTLVVGEDWPGLVWERWGLGRVLRRGDLLFAPTNLLPASWGGPSVLVLFDTLQEVRPADFPWHVRARFGTRYRRAARRAERVLVPSEATARDVARIHGIPADRLRVIYPAPAEGFRPLAPTSPEVVEARRALGLGDEPFFLFVGKRSRRRHVAEVLGGFDRHRRRHPTHRLVLAGPPDSLESDPIQGVHVVSHVDEPTLRGLMASALGVLYPSEYEGFGLPVVEAMASGCPVVTLRNSALTESGGEAAIYLDSPEPDAIAHAMNELADDPDERARRVAMGLAHVARFRRDAFAAAVKDELRATAPH